MSDNMPKQGEFCWNELMTPSAPQAIEFYSALFDWSANDHNMPNGQTYTIFKSKDGKDVCGLMQTPPEAQKNNVPPHWMSYIKVDDLDAMVKKSESLGAKIVMPSTKAGDFGRFAVIQDPTGATFSFWESSKSC